jgi:hypothetical protein
MQLDQQGLNILFAVFRRDKSFNGWTGPLEGAHTIMLVTLNASKVGNQ